MSSPAIFQKLLDWIQEKKSFLLVTHTNPDGDALGSLFGLQLALRENGYSSSAFIQKSISERYLSFVPEGLLVGRELDLTNFDAIVCLDSANEERLALPNGLDFRNVNLPSCNLDHHQDNPEYGEINFVDSVYAATTELLSDFLKHSGFLISPNVATSLYLGIITDTGGFRYDNTTPRTLRSGAWLLEQKADHSRIMQKVFFEEPLNFLRMQARLVETMKFAFNKRLAYFILTPKLFSEFSVTEKGCEDIIDKLRVIKGVEIICRFQQVETGIRLSLRSKNQKLPVDSLAKELGGGGHKMAAGAFLKTLDLKEGERILKDHARKIFENLC